MPPRSTSSWAGTHIPHPVWAIDSTGGYGAGPTWFLAARRKQSDQAAVGRDHSRYASGATPRGAGGKLPDASPRCQGRGSDGAPLAGGQAVGSLAGMPGLSRREAGMLPGCPHRADHRRIRPQSWVAQAAASAGAAPLPPGKSAAGWGRGHRSCRPVIWADSGRGLRRGNHPVGVRTVCPVGGTIGCRERQSSAPHARHARPQAVTGTVIHGVPEGATTVPTRQRRLPVLPRVAGPSEAGSATCHRAEIRP